jgi:hypothetical protein
MADELVVLPTPPCVLEVEMQASHAGEISGA